MRLCSSSNLVSLKIKHPLLSKIEAKVEYVSSAGYVHEQ